MMRTVVLTEQAIKKLRPGVLRPPVTPMLDVGQQWAPSYNSYK
jgi:hypothetical protein